MITSCETINDLMPLYIEKLTSEDSNREIEEHLKVCHSCSKNLKNFQKKIDDDFIGDDFDESDKAARGAVMKFKKRNITVLAIILIFGIWLGGFSATINVIKYFTVFSPSQALERQSWIKLNNPVVVAQERINKKYDMIIYEDGVKFGTAILSHRLGRKLWFVKSLNPGQYVELGKPFEIDALGASTLIDIEYILTVKVADPKIKYIVLGQIEEVEYGVEPEHPSLDEVKNNSDSYNIKEVENGYVYFFYDQEFDYKYWYQIRAYDNEGNLIAENITYRTSRYPIQH